MCTPALRSLASLAAIVVAGCADLALEPGRIPHSLSISPEDARVKEGDVGEFTVTVLDEDGQVIPGPPAWAPAAWEVADPSMVEFGPDGSFTALANGEARIGARSAGLLARTTLLISPGSVRLTAPAVYLNQAIQRLDGTVPLIAGRKALLRVFVTGDEVSYYEPRAYADFLLGGRVIHTAPMDPPHVIPDAVDEKWRLQSFNAEIPGEVIRPGVQLSVENRSRRRGASAAGQRAEGPGGGRAGAQRGRASGALSDAGSGDRRDRPPRTDPHLGRGHDRRERVAPVRAQRASDR